MKDIKKGLYLVPTPIGNLGDITLRAIEILRASEYILCEDTRVSRNLLVKYEIKSKLISNHKFNEKRNLANLSKLLKDGAIISLISDAGTPTISDPGEILIRECVKNNIKVIPLPGSSAVSLAISISGFSEKFIFFGFFPEKNTIINENFSKLSQLNLSVVFFVSPKKINKAIPIIKNFFAGRKIVICREMTKMFEEFIREDVDSLKLFNKELKGELTIVISPKINDKKIENKLKESDKLIIKKMINKLSVKEITGLINQQSKISKKEIYNYCLKLKNEN
tara:strand:- start:2620 stop:3459 length:840 start_codon:yes stop_codon:yes gene_type:complete